MTHPIQATLDRGKGQSVTIAVLALGGALLLAAGSALAGRGGAFEGTVEQVWDDGFRLDTGSRKVTADAYDLCGDFTHRHLAVGERLRITGEFEDGEFDVFTIARADGRKVCG